MVLGQSGVGEDEFARALRIPAADFSRICAAIFSQWIPVIPRDRFTSMALSPTGHSISGDFWSRMRGCAVRIVIAPDGRELVSENGGAAGHSGEIAGVPYQVIELIGLQFDDFC